MLATLTLSILTALFASDEGSLHIDKDHGYQVEVPAQWKTVEAKDTKTGHVLTLLPPDSVGLQAVKIAAKETTSEFALSQAVLKNSEALVAAGVAEESLETFASTLGGVAAKGLRCQLEQGGTTYQIEQLFCVQSEQLIVVQKHAPWENWEASFESLNSVVASIEWIERTLPDPQVELRRKLIARCGSQVNWAADWTAAKARAEEMGRPILVVTYFMQAFALPNTPMQTTFMDRDIVSLVNSRFVPVYVTQKKDLELFREDGSVYGMGPSLLGQALFVTDASGRILAETSMANVPDVALPFLLGQIAQKKGEVTADGLASVRKGATRVELAELGLDGGELVLAKELLKGELGAQAVLQRSRLFRLEGDGVGALRALDVELNKHSASAKYAAAELADLQLARGELLFRLGQSGKATEALRTVIADPNTRDSSLARALLGAGVIELWMDRQDAAQLLLQRVLDDFPGEDSAWLAAAALDSPSLGLGVRAERKWVSADTITDALLQNERTPAKGQGPERADLAAKGAVEWLLAAQREDGSFPGPTEVTHNAAFGANPFADATVAIAGRALLLARDVELGDAEQLTRAATRSLNYVRASMDSRASNPPAVFFMDYMTWSDAALLDFVLLAAKRGLASPEELQPYIELMLLDLANRQQSNGGWSYYKKTDLNAEEVPSQSIAPTTAWVSLALSRAVSISPELAKPLLSKVTKALRELRDERGTFSYFLYGTGVEPHAKIADPRGDVGRGPACELALFKAGASDAKRLAKSVELLLAHGDLYMAEQGKAMMHAGPQGQGCHYLLFDYAHAAFAVAELEGENAIQARVLDLILDCQVADGAFLDTPIIGRSYGTAMALLGLLALR